MAAAAVQSGASDIVATFVGALEDESPAVVRAVLDAELTQQRALLERNGWTDDDFVELEGRRLKVPARTLAKRRIRELKPIAKELGCSEQLARVEWMLEKGTGSQRQLQVWNANRDIVEVTEEIADATEAV